MKKLLLATVSMLALSTAARAADLPAKARTYAPDSYPIWTGGYIGIQGGVTRHDASFTDLNFSITTIEGNKTGGTFGGLLGYNWQRGSFVYGLEGDWNWVGAKAAASDLGLSSAGFNAKSSFDVDWVATVRGRAGLAVDATLIYLTGGIAFGHVKNSFTSFTGPDVLLDFAQNRTKVGWIAGAGGEHMFGPHWTARAEFRYVDLGTTSSVACSNNNVDCAQFSYRGEFSNTLMQGLVGLTYKF